MARNVKDRPVAAGLPRSFRGQDQLDGTPTTMLTQQPASFAKGGPRPLADRPPAPSRPDQSGMETSMAQLADREHPTGR